MTAVSTESYIHQGQGNGGERRLTNVSWSKGEDSQTVNRVNNTFGIPYRVLKLVGSSMSSRL